MERLVVGDKLRRIVEGRGAPIGHIYTIRQYDFPTGGEGTDYIADGGFIKELLSQERLKEYEPFDEQG